MRLGEVPAQGIRAARHFQAKETGISNQRIIVSFFCDIDGKTFYSAAARKLEADCSRVGVECRIVERNYGTNWIDNVRAKPLFIKEMLLELNRPLIFLDVDCELIDLDFPVLADWGFVLRADGMPCDFVHCVNNVERNLEFLEIWIDEIRRCGKGSHAALQNIFSSLDFFTIPEGHFRLHLAETESKSRYFKEKWKKPE